MRLYFRYQYYICTCTVFTLIIRDAKNNNYFLNHELFKFGPAKNGVRELMESRIIVCANELLQTGLQNYPALSQLSVLHLSLESRLVCTRGNL